MELWGWLVIYVVLFALLHLVLYFYYVRREGDDRTSTASFAENSVAGARYGTPMDRSPGGHDESDADRRHREEYDLEFDGDTIDCAHCGAPNDSDSTYTYCWNCVSTLRQ